MATGQKYWNRVHCDCCGSVRLFLQFGKRLQQRFHCQKCGCIFRIELSHMKQIKCKSCVR